MSPRKRKSGGSLPLSTDPKATLTLTLTLPGRMINDLDKDGDGQVTAEEWVSQFEAHEQSLAKFFPEDTLRDLKAAFETPSSGIEERISNDQKSGNSKDSLEFVRFQNEFALKQLEMLNKKLSQAYKLSQAIHDEFYVGLKGDSKGNISPGTSAPHEDPKMKKMFDHISADIDNVNAFMTVLRQGIPKTKATAVGEEIPKMKAMASKTSSKEGSGNAVSSKSQTMEVRKQSEIVRRASTAKTSSSKSS